MNILYTPKYFKTNNIEEFLEKAQFVFKIKGELQTNFRFDTSKTTEFDILGILMIYKFLEYSVKNDCFLKPGFGYTKTFMASFKEYSFSNLSKKFLKIKDDIDDYPTDFDLTKLDIKIDMNNNFIIGAFPLQRDNKVHQPKIADGLTSRLVQFYANDSKTVKMITSTISEVISNFWEHAIEDKSSIIVAKGRKTVFEFACADTASGIVSTLRKNKKYENQKPEILLKKSILQKVSSKENTPHMGLGLWTVNEYVTKTNGKLYIYSEGYSLTNISGRVIVKKAPYWKGTIIHINLPLDNPVILSDIISDSQKVEISKFKLNKI